MLYIYRYTRFFIDALITNSFAYFNFNSPSQVDIWDYRLELARALFQRCRAGAINKPLVKPKMHWPKRVGTRTTACTYNGCKNRVSTYCGACNIFYCGSCIDTAPDQ